MRDRALYEVFSEGAFPYDAPSPSSLKAGWKQLISIAIASSCPGSQSSHIGIELIVISLRVSIVCGFVNVSVTLYMGHNLNEAFTWREDLLKLLVNVVDIKIVYLAVVYIFIEFYNGL